MTDRTYTEEEAREENWERTKREHKKIFPYMLLDLTSLELKRIDIRTSSINNHEHAEIKKDTPYLVGNSGRWSISNAQRMYRNNGWEFIAGGMRIGLGRIDFLFELRGLPMYDDEPLGRVSAALDNDCDMCYNNCECDICPNCEFNKWK